MPSATTCCMLSEVVITTLWPIAATGILPTCLSVILNSEHDAGTVIELTLYCIASLLSISVSQPLMTATLLPLPGAVDDVAAGSTGAASAGAASAGAVAAGAVSAGGVMAAGASLVAGVAAESAGSDLSPQADRASAHAAVNRVILMFIQQPPGGNGKHGSANDVAPCEEIIASHMIRPACAQAGGVPTLPDRDPRQTARCVPITRRTRDNRSWWRERKRADRRLWKAARTSCPGHAAAACTAPSCGDALRAHPVPGAAAPARRLDAARRWLTSACAGARRRCGEAVACARTAPSAVFPCALSASPARLRSRGPGQPRAQRQAARRWRAGRRGQARYRAGSFRHAGPAPGERSTVPVRCPARRCPARGGNVRTPVRARPPVSPARCPPPPAVH